MDRISAVITIKRVVSGSETMVCTVPITSKSKVRKTLMKEDSLSLVFSLDEKVAFYVGDYIDDEIFGRYYLTKKTMPKVAGKRYDYTLSFEKDYLLWRNKVFMLVSYGERKETEWSLTANLAAHGGQVVSNLRALGYQVSLDVANSATHSAEIRCITYKGVDIIQGIDEIAKQFNCEYWVTGGETTGFVIHFGKCESVNTLHFDMVDNVESIDIQRNKSIYANKVYFYGSTKNVPNSYRKHLSFHAYDKAERSLMKRYPILSGCLDNQGREVPSWAAGYEEQAITSYIFMREGERIIVSSYDQSARIFRYSGDATSGTMIQGTEYTAPSDTIVRVRANAHNNLIVAINRTAVVYLTNMPFSPDTFADDYKEISIGSNLQSRETVFEGIYTITGGPLFRVTRKEQDTTVQIHYSLFYVDEDRTEIASGDCLLSVTSEMPFVTERCKFNGMADIHGTGTLQLEFTRVSGEDVDITLEDSHSIYFNPANRYRIFNLIRNNATYQAEFNPLNAEKGTDEYTAIKVSSLPNSFDFSPSLDSLNITTIPDTLWIDDNPTQTNTNAIGERRLLLPERDEEGDALNGYLTTPEASSAPATVEKTVIFDNVFPKCLLRITDIQEVKRQDANQYEDGTKETWQWTQYIIRVTLADGSPFLFKTSYLLPGQSLEAAFLTADESASISQMQAGQHLLSGMHFDLKFNDADQTFIICRNEDYGQKLPNEVIRPHVGDILTLIGWNPKAIHNLGLVENAERELLAEARNWMAVAAEDELNFVCKMMSNYVRLFDTLPTIGQKVTIALDDDNVKTSRIQSVEYSMDIPYKSPTYTVGNSDRYSRISELEEKTSGGNNPSGVSSTIVSDNENVGAGKNEEETNGYITVTEAAANYVLKTELGNYYNKTEINTRFQNIYSKNEVDNLLASYTPISSHDALAGRVGTVEGYFTSGNAKNALKLENHPASYFATASSVTSLTTRVTALEARKRFEDYFEIDQYGDIHVLYNRGFYSDSFVSAGGRSNTQGGGSGLSVYTSSALGGTFSDTDDSVFNAYTVNALHGRIAALENSTPNVAWGTPGADYSPLTINGVTRNLLTTHQAIYPLTIKVAGTTRTIYNPSSAAANWNFVAGTGITLTGASGQVTIAIASGYATQTWVNTNFYNKTQVDNMVSAIPKFKVEVVQTLPAVGDSATVYLVPTQNDPQNLYTEYIYVDNAWEQLGTQGTDLTGYVNTLTNSGSGNYVTGITKSGNTLTVTYGTLPTTIALANVNDADDLKAIEALTGTTGLLKKTAANTWTLDTTAYLSSHQAVTLAPGTNDGTLKLTTAAGVVDNIAVKGLGTNAFSSEEYLPLTAGGSHTITGDLYTTKWIVADPEATETETNIMKDFRIYLRNPNNASTYVFMGRATKSKATDVITYYTYLNGGHFTCQYTQSPAGTQGYRYFTVGSSIAKSNANSGCGAIRLYGLTNADSAQAYMVTLRPAVITSAKTIVIPDKAGTMALTTDNVASATVLATARNINGTAFDGSAAITTALWGTARNITISDSDSTNTGTAVSVNGSANVNLLLPATIKATLSGTATYATALATARTLWGQSFDGSANITGAMTDVTNIDSLLYLDTTNSRIGIGQSSPAYKLDVAGTFRATGNSQIGGALGVTGLATFGNNVRLSGHSLYFDSSHSKYAVYDTTVGGLHFNCGIYSDSWVSAGGVSTTSDINLKTDFVKVKLTVKDIAGAPAFDFAWKDGRGRSAGSIAQYWKKLLPNNVSTISGKYLAMEYGNIALLSAITIAKAVESQEAKIERLEKRVEELESQLLKQ